MVLASTNGVINDMWYGGAGNVSLVVPKDTALISAVLAKFSGTFKSDIDAQFDLRVTSLNEVILNNAQGIVNIGGSPVEVLICPFASNIIANDCALTAESIGNVLLNAVANKGDIAGVGNFIGGTNANDAEIDSYLITQGTNLADVLLGLSLWTITFNT
jgi:hypothetical protein